MKRLIVCLAVVLWGTAFAGGAAVSGPYRVHGVVVDSLSAEPEAMATVVVSAKGSAKEIVNVCDDQGAFVVDLSAAGEYSLRVVSVGKLEKTVDFEVSPSSPVADLGKISVVPDPQQLDAAVVAAQVPFVKTEVDRLSYQVSEDPDSKTSNALDILRKIPRVTVDGEDKIKVNGQSNFKIYVNGRPSNLFSNNPEKLLKSMPAEGIRKVEVISDPGAKYDAEGVGGILNIVMNSKRSDGYNINVNVAGGNRGGNAGAYAAAKFGKFAVSANYGFNYYSSKGGSGSSDMTSYDADGNMVQRVVSSSDMGRQTVPMHFGSLEMSYEIDSLNLLTLSGNLFSMNGRTGFNMQQTSYGPTEDSPYNYSYIQVGDSRYGNSSVSGNIDYQHLFKSLPGSAFTLSYRYSNDPSTMMSDYSVSESVGEVPYLHNRVFSSNKGSSQEHTVQADYSLPFAKIHRIEAGLKYIGRINASDGVNQFKDSPDDQWQEDTDSPSLTYRHTQHIAAAYADYALSLDKFGVKAGVRAEQTIQKIRYVKPQADDVNSDFFDIVPNMTLMWAPTPMQSLQLTYNMRISRPGITQLSPFKIRQTGGNVMYGNPDIVSEKSHSLSLNYSVFAMKYGVNASVRYAFTNNSIGVYSFLDGDGVLNTTYGNIGKNSVASLMAYAYWNPTQNTRLFFNGDLSYRMYSGASGNDYLSSLTRDGFAGNVYAGLQQTFKYAFRLGVSGGYFASGVTLQGKGSGSYFYSLSLSKSFLDGKLDLSASASNFIEPYMKYRSDTDTPYLKGYNLYRNPSRYFQISLSYSFGNLQGGVKKVRKSIVNDDVVSSGSSQMGGAPSGAAGSGSGTGGK